MPVDMLSDTAMIVGMANHALQHTLCHLQATVTEIWASSWDLRPYCVSLSVGITAAVARPQSSAKPLF
jgi:hypothetical protein